MYKRLRLGLLLSLLPALLAAPLAHAQQRLKDITSVAGVRTNQLVGYGLVVGLDGTGDKTNFTSQTFRNMLNNFGVAIPPNIDPKSKNIAAVAIHADLPPFAKPGQTIDVTVSTIGRQKPPWRQPADGAAERGRWQRLRHRPGQPGGVRLRRHG